MDGNDQWKHGGNCNHCRRAKYCKKECSAHKRFMQYVVRQLIANKMAEGLAKAKTEESSSDG